MKGARGDSGRNGKALKIYKKDIVNTHSILQVILVRLDFLVHKVDRNGQGGTIQQEKLHRSRLSWSKR